jgi:hypothetical protein
MKDNHNRHYLRDTHVKGSVPSFLTTIFYYKLFCMSFKYLAKIINISENL